LIQAVILLVAYGFIYQQVFSDHGGQQFSGLIREFRTLGSEKLLAAVVFGLMFLNWGTEAAKWKYLIDRIEKVSFLQSIKAVLTGITISTFTPNRIGEYFGRAFILKKAHPVDAIILTVIGSMSQLLVTVMAGTTSFLFLLPQISSKIGNRPAFIIPGLIVLSLFINAAFILIYINVGAIRPLARYLMKRNWRKVYRYIAILSRIHPDELAKVIVFSILRYFIFFIQFYLALRLFNVRLSFQEALMLLPVIYLAQAIVPTIALTELGVRGSVAIFVIGTYLLIHGSSTEHLAPSILSATSLIWMINLAFPAIIGTFFVFNLRFFRR
jgi:hypothetical protein